MIDFAGGLVYVHGVSDVEPVRQMVHARRGYTIVLPGPISRQGELASGTLYDRSRSDPWGHVPDGLNLVRSLKARWDPDGLLDPGAFIV